jgi:hypothetical protein
VTPIATGARPATCCAFAEIADRRGFAMKHVVLFVAMVITCVIAAAANVEITRAIDFNLFRFKLWLIVPVGAIGMGMLAASGAIVAARVLQIVPTRADAVLMVLVAAATMLLIYYGDYATMTLDDGRKVADLIDFRTYVDLVMTKTHMRIGSGRHDTGEVGNFGYALAAIEFVGFLLGGAFAFSIIKGLPRCAECGAYLRTLKTRKSNEMTIDEVGHLIDAFRSGDINTAQKATSWAPPDRTFERKAQRATVTFRLLGCPKCQAEAVTASVNVFNGKTWTTVTALKSRRDLPLGLSWVHQFA